MSRSKKVFIAGVSLLIFLIAFVGEGVYYSPVNCGSMVVLPE
jgi:hypothetical protein